jgi:hypothetical protein
MLIVLLKLLCLDISACLKIGGFNIPANIDLDIVQSPTRYTSCFLNLAFGVVCDMQY